MSTQPTDAELIAELEVSGVAFMKSRGGLGGTKEVWTTSGSQDAKKIAQGMRAAIAKWGQPAQAAEPVAREPLPKFLALKFHARRDKKAAVTLLFPGHEAADAWVRGSKGGQHGTDT